MLPNINSQLKVFAPDNDVFSSKEFKTMASNSKINAIHTQASVRSGRMVLQKDAFALSLREHAQHFFTHLHVGQASSTNEFILYQ